ncbi:hypothetical protein [Psychrobacter frigidicola]|uniref:hypothetical protein n=1 Tax=Psychrobacter frigidicola TaxID=45611 RepID=UPI00191A99AB|nr:hypothetical protein [Psychrobacter frigidicola]
MTAPSGWQRKLASLFKSEKIMNAGKIVKTFNDKSIDEMKASIITISMCDSMALSPKPRTKDLEDHLDNLKHQFIGQSELCFYHATLIVLLRRNYKPEETFAEFERLWITETVYLLNHLSLRWIISACDTFIDHTTDTTRAAILMNVTTLINTLKVYETEQFLQQNPNSEPLPLVADKVDVLYRSDLPLYEGLTYFRIGTDDTLKHMRSRYENFYDADKLAATMLLFVFDKLQTNNSAFSTLRALHRDDKSKWWIDIL